MTTKIIRADDLSVSKYFTFNNQNYYADLSDVFWLHKYYEFMIFRCNQRWTVDYSSDVYVENFDCVSEKNFLKWIKKFKKRIVKHN